MADTQRFRITSLQSPHWKDNNLLWEFYRLCNEGGQAFKNVCLTRFSTREDDTDYALRKNMSYTPPFAKVAVHKVLRSIYQRMSEIRRVGGSEAYQNAICGLCGGVDRQGKSMNSFMGQSVLPELATTGMVGVFVDKAEKKNDLLIFNKTNTPYLFVYAAEDIYNYQCYYQDNMQIFVNLLIKMTDFIYDPTTGFEIGTETFYRRFWINEDGFVQVDDYSYDAESKQDVIKRSKVTQLRFIPFVIGRISESLYTDIGDYQRGLLNLASADLNYCFRSNFPFLVEEQDMAYNAALLNRAPAVDAIGTVNEALTAKTNQTASVGPSRGRIYGKGLKAPDFISPPSEPLLASMEKQRQMQAEIEKILHLTITNLKPTQENRSNNEDSSVNTGLSYIGEELQFVENTIARFWSMYENIENAKPAQINYPEKYELKSDSDRISLAKELVGLKGAAPSRTFQKAIGKEISEALLSGKTTLETLNIIDKEIDAAEYITSDCLEVAKDIENGLVDHQTASTARGYNGPQVIEKARQEHLDRLTAIAIAQAKNKGDGQNAARGVPVSPQDKTAKEEKDVAGITN
jgi:hypothetical protein